MPELKFLCFKKFLWLRYNFRVLTEEELQQRHKEARQRHTAKLTGAALAEPAMVDSDNQSQSDSEGTCNLNLVPGKELLPYLQ